MKAILLILMLVFTSCGSIPTATELVDAVAGRLGDSDSTVEEAAEEVEEIAAEELEEMDDDEYEVGIIGDTLAPDRFFMGTWEKKFQYTPCPDWPSVIRIYSYDNKIDIEDNSQSLISQGSIFIDDTVDIHTQYLDTFGRPLLALDCTCTIDESVYYDDEFACTCEYGGSSCGLRYTKY